MLSRYSQPLLDRHSRVDPSQVKPLRPTNFNAWMCAVDAACIRRSGLSIYDLADCCFHDWYDDGMTPAAAARHAIRYEMGEEG